MEMNFEKGVFRAPVKKLPDISMFSKNMLCNASKNKRWVPVKAIASLAGKAQFMHLAIPVARFYLRELHDVVSSAAAWLGTVRLSKQLKRDLEWWRTVPESTTARPHLQACRVLLPGLRLHRFRLGCGPQRLHRSPRFLDGPRQAPAHHLQGAKGGPVRDRVLPPVGVLTHLTSRSPSMMSKLRKLFLLTDEHDISIKTRYIRSAANVWAYRLSRETDNSDWQLATRVFRYYDKIWGLTPSIISPPSRTSSSRATTPSGGTGRQRQWTPSTSQIGTGSMKPTRATHLGPSRTTSQQSCDNKVRGPQSSPTTGHASRGSPISPRWPPRWSKCPLPRTSSPRSGERGKGG
jgi:hypothetical protein